MKIHYLEIVTIDVESVCSAYASSQNINFTEPEQMLGGARVGVLAAGSLVGIRAPLRDTEMSVVRPYWLVDDIDSAVENVEAQGAEIAVPPLEIPGKGKFAIYLQGGIEHGFWQL